MKYHLCGSKTKRSGSRRKRICTQGHVLVVGITGRWVTFANSLRRTITGSNGSTGLSGSQLYKHYV